MGWCLEQTLELPPVKWWPTRCAPRSITLLQIYSKSHTCCTETMNREIYLQNTLNCYTIIGLSCVMHLLFFCNEVSFLVHCTFYNKLPLFLPFKLFTTYPRMQYSDLVLSIKVWHIRAVKGKKTDCPRYKLWLYCILGYWGVCGSNYCLIFLIFPSLTS